MAAQFTLGNKEKLKSRKDIETLFARGRSFSVSPFRIFYLLNAAQPSQPPLQFAVAVSTKNFKRAVDRNRLKRLTREAYRLQKQELQEMALEKRKQLKLFFIYSSNELPDFGSVKNKVGVALKKLAESMAEVPS